MVRTGAFLRLFQTATCIGWLHSPRYTCKQPPPPPPPPRPDRKLSRNFENERNLQRGFFKNWWIKDSSSHHHRSNLQCLTPTNNHKVNKQKRSCNSAPLKLIEAIIPLSKCKYSYIYRKGDCLKESIWSVYMDG